MNEQWLPAPGYEGRYEVSSLGRVRSLPRMETTRHGHRRPVAGGVLNPSLNTDGYLHVSLRIAGKLRLVSVHRLVASAFHGDKRNALHREVAHLDGNRANARADNLKWVSRVENCSHKLAHGTHQIGDRAGNRKLTSSQVIEIRGARNSSTAGALAARYGVSDHTIYDIWSRKIWRHIPPVHESPGAQSAIAQPPVLS